MIDPLSTVSYDGDLCRQKYHDHCTPRLVHPISPSLQFTAVVTHPDLTAVPIVPLDDLTTIDEDFGISTFKYGKKEVEYNNSSSHNHISDTENKNTTIAQRTKHHQQCVSPSPVSSTRLYSASLLELICLTSFNFPYGLICGTFVLWILPVEALRLFPETQSVTLGLSLGVIGVTQLVCPVAGKISDLYSSASQFGKRKPFILTGCFGAILFTLGMWYTSWFMWGYLYYFCLFGGMSCLNVIYSVGCGLVPDVLDETLQGRSNGLIAVHSLLGASVGFGLVILSANHDFHFVYSIYIVLVLISCGVTSWVAHHLENRLQFQLAATLQGRSKTWQDHPGKEYYPSRKKYIPVPSNQEMISDACRLRGDQLSENSVLQKSTSETIELGYNHRSFLMTSNSEETYIYPPDNHTLSSDETYTEGGLSEKSAKVKSNLVGRVLKPQNVRGILSKSSSNKDIDDVYRPSHLSDQKPHVTIANDYNSSEDQDRRGMEPKLLMTSSSYVVTAGLNGQHRVGVEDKTKFRLTLGEIISWFCIDTSESHDFFWVFIGRTLYYVGVSVQAFMPYYLRDVVGTEDEGLRQLQVGCLALMAQSTAACIAYPVGRLTDTPNNIGRKPLIYLGCLCMSIVYLCFLFSPIFGSNAFLFVLLMSAFYGAGNGCFLAVDYALALATIPKNGNVTQALGLWGVSAFIGSALGPLLWGVLIEGFGRDPLTGNYSYPGYVAVLLSGIDATLSAGGVIKLVKHAK